MNRGEERGINVVEIVSILVGGFSIILTIYLTRNIALQVGFAVIIVISIIFIILANNYTTISRLSKESKIMSQQLSLLKERLNIYDRLNKLENKVFKVIK